MVLGALCFCCQASCCCCHAMQTCYSCLRCSKASSRVRQTYFVMFSLCAIVAWILRDYGHEGLKRVGGFKDCEDNEECTGNGAVLRICLAMVLFFSLLFVLVLGVKSSKDPRAVVQNDFFSLKTILLGGLIVATFFLDNQDATNFAAVSVFFAALFLIFGIVLVIEFAHGWNDRWVQRYEDSDHSKAWGVIIIGTALLLYGASITLWVVIIEFYGGENCTETNTFVAITIILSVVITILSVLDKVENGALLPCGVMVLYATYLCLSAVLDLPTDNDNACINRRSKVSNETQRVVDAAGVIFTIFAIGYATVRSASKGNDLSGGNTKGTEEKAEAEDGEMQAEAEEDEEDSTMYNYAFFQAVCATGSMYLAMVLVNWNLQLIEGNDVVGNDNANIPVYVKMTTQWVAFALFTWSLVAPLVCTSRDFS